MAKKKVFQISDALTEGLEETITAAHRYSGELRIDVIPLKKIEVDPENPRDLLLGFQDIQQGLSETDPNYLRKSHELESLHSLANSICDQGIINPIVVYKFGEKYRLVAGERRTLASFIAGKTDIQAKILENKPSELKVSLLQWIENVERSDLTLWERLRNLQKVVHLYAVKNKMGVEDVTVTMLSNLIGCSKPHAMNYKAVLMADMTIKQLIQENKIKNLEKAALLASFEIPAVRQQAIEACLQGAPLKKLKLMMKQHKVNPALANVTKKVETRGRHASAVYFATKNIQVAQLIFNAISSHPELAYSVGNFPTINWRDYKSINHSFRELVKRLEKEFV